MDVGSFNRAWLLAWTNKDVPALLEFYHPETRYFDAQCPGGIAGHEALRAYLTGLFAATPPMTYEADDVWAIADGFCGRWICTMVLPDGSKRFMRGFDLVELRDDRIILNEVYTHALAGDPR